METAKPEAPNQQSITLLSLKTPMKTNHQSLNTRRASRWLTVGRALVLLFGAHLGQAAEAVFNDGLTHTISDASFQNDTIIVENGTTLIINTGAVFGGAGIDSGKIDAKDTSTVTINGGIFGGAGERSGHVFARGTSTITILGGDLRRHGTECGNRSGDH